MSKKIFCVRGQVQEWYYTSGKAYSNPTLDVELDVVFTCPDGGTLTMPAFWAGDGDWGVRFTPPTVGGYTYETVCSDVNNLDLHGVKGTLEVSEYQGDNPLIHHGGPKVSQDGRFFQYEDETPFFWLGDTWWMSLCKRLSWPEDFKELVADRKAKGFTVIQVVAGLYPDMPYMDPRGANEAGFPWTQSFDEINPSYYDMVDLRIAHLVRNGLVPCIVGSWGYFLPWMGVAAMKRHWRYLVARYGAYPVVWCLAGEGAMPYYLSQDAEGDRKAQIDGWTKIGEYVHQVDPYKRMVTIHPTNCSREQVADVNVLDFEMLQTGHSGIGDLPNTVKSIRKSYNSEPKMPVINGEVCYEGILEGSREEVQRTMFWACILSGACGHTYGANGIWQVNEPGKPYGASPHGSSWGDTSWQKAASLPGSSQLAVGKAILSNFPWWRFTPHQEWVEPCAEGDRFMAGYAAGIPGEVRVIYFPSAHNVAPWSPPAFVKGIERDVEYSASFFDPKTGQETVLGPVQSDESGNWRIPRPEVMQDWVLVLKATS